MTPSPLDSANAVQGNSPEPPIGNYNRESRFARHNRQHTRIGAILRYKFATGVFVARTGLWVPTKLAKTVSRRNSRPILQRSGLVPWRGTPRTSGESLLRVVRYRRSRFVRRQCGRPHPAHERLSGDTSKDRQTHVQWRLPASTDPRFQVSEYIRRATRRRPLSPSILQHGYD